MPYKTALHLVKNDAGNLFHESKDLSQNIKHMNIRLTLLMFSFLLGFGIGLNSQPTVNMDKKSLPLKSGNSVLFGEDIVINNIPDQNQRQVAICSAFNGWLYAAYSYTDQVNQSASTKILKSTDNGTTWTTIIPLVLSGVFPKFMALDIAVVGDSDSDLKLFLAFVAGDSPVTGIGDGNVWRYDEQTGTYEGALLVDNSSYDISLCSDFIYPASNSNPHSLGILFSKHQNSSQKDSIIFCSSSNGGLSIDNRKSIAWTSNKFKNIDLSYGRSLSNSSGRYYAVWEENADFGSSSGHVYTAHSEPDFNSPFTTPVMLDSIDATAYNNASNPSIACQYNNIDNDSSNITEVVLFNKYIPATGKYDIEGLYNMKSTNTSHFKNFMLDSSMDSKMEPCIAFNPFDSAFMVTYYNTTTQELPFVRNDFNMIHPDNWVVVSAGYNDSANLSATHPKVALNVGQKQGAFVWASEGVALNGVAMFDAPYLFTGISSNKTNDYNYHVSIFPNPCKAKLNVAFEIKSQERLTLSICNFSGQYLGELTDQVYQAGKHIITHDVSSFPTGNYLISFRTESNLATYNILIIR